MRAFLRSNIHMRYGLVVANPLRFGNKSAPSHNTLRSNNPCITKRSITQSLQKITPVASEQKQSYSATFKDDKFKTNDLISWGLLLVALFNQ